MYQCRCYYDWSSDVLPGHVLCFCYLIEKCSGKDNTKSRSYTRARAHTHTSQASHPYYTSKTKKVAQCLEQGCGFVFSLLLQQLYTLVLLTAHQHILLRFAGDSELPKLGHAPCMSGQKRRGVNHHCNHNQFKIPRKQKGKK